MERENFFVVHHTCIARRFYRCLLLNSGTKGLRNHGILKIQAASLAKLNFKSMVKTQVKKNPLSNLIGFGLGEA